MFGFEPVIRTSRRLERERQLELDEDALVGQVGDLEDVGHRAERVAPGRDLGRRRPVAELVEEAVGELVGEPRLRRVRDELLGGALVEVQPLPPARRPPRPTDLDYSGVTMPATAHCLADIRHWPDAMMRLEVRAH